jgi:hypothetical protein
MPALLFTLLHFATSFLICAANCSGVLDVALFTFDGAASCTR